MANMKIPKKERIAASIRCAAAFGLCQPLTVKAIKSGGLFPIQRKKSGPHAKAT